MEATDETSELNIPKSGIIPLFKRFGMVKNELGAVLDIKGEANDRTMQEAISWWNTLDPPRQDMARGALNALSAPVLIADFRIVFADDATIFTRCLIDSLKPDDPLFFIGTDKDTSQYRITRSQVREKVTNTFMLYLSGLHTPQNPGITFSLTNAGALTLFAITDLYRRQWYSARLNHMIFNLPLSREAILGSIRDGIDKPDPRWLVPFYRLHLIHPSGGMTGNELEKELSFLETNAILLRSPDGLTYTLTQKGEYLVSAFDRRHCTLGMSVAGSRDDGILGMQSVLFIRSELSLWIFDIRNDGTVTCTSIDLGTAQRVLEGLLMPSAVPRPLSSLPGDTVGQPEPARTPINLPRMEQSISPATGIKTVFCGNCGNPVIPGRKFCENCGTAIGSAPIKSQKVTTCQKCGKELKPGVKFCRNCGNKIA